MYYRHDLDYDYPERSDAHMITVKHLRDVELDVNYPYLQKSFWFKCQRGLLRVCQYTVLPLVMWVRHGLHIHGKEKRTGAYPKGYSATWKKAVVKLSADSKNIEIFEGMV